MSPRRVVTVKDEALEGDMPKFSSTMEYCVRMVPILMTVIPEDSRLSRQLKTVVLAELMMVRLLAHRQ